MKYLGGLAFLVATRISTCHRKTTAFPSKPQESKSISGKLPLHTHQLFRGTCICLYVCIIIVPAISTLQKVVKLHIILCMYVYRCVLYYVYHVCMCIGVWILLILLHVFCSKCRGDPPQGCVLVSLPLRCGQYYSGVTLEDDTSCFDNFVRT